tara:strand:+ start:175 stop:333 length:159 start_codon:yes stop_codon:yes gene_type:complete
MFDKKILEIVICPKTGQELVYDSKKKILITIDGKVSYKIKNGIPMLVTVLND